jgi:hypothetical protein
VGSKFGRRFTLSRASECWVSRAVQAAIEATTDRRVERRHRHQCIPALALDSGGYDRRKAGDREPYLRPDHHARRRARVLNISV